MGWIILIKITIVYSDAPIWIIINVDTKFGFNLVVIDRDYYTEIMNYIRLVVFFLALSFGVASLFTIWFLYLRFRNKLLKIYFFLFLFVTGLVLTDMIDVLGSILQIGLINGQEYSSFLDSLSFT